MNENEVMNDVMENIEGAIEETLPAVTETLPAKKGIPSGLVKAGLIVGGTTAGIFVWEKAVKPVGKKLISKLKAKRAARKAAKEGIDPRDVEVINVKDYKVD